MKDERIEYYEKAASSYDARRFQCACKRMVDRQAQEAVYAQLQDCTRILDAGTGTGRFALFLADKGKRVIAADASYNMLAQARAKAETQGVGKVISFVQADIRNLPFADGAFDGLCSIHVLVHFPSPAQPLSEFARVVQHGGTVVVDLASGVLTRFYLRIKKMVSPSSFTYPDYYPSYTVMKKHLMEHKMEVRSVTPVKKMPTPVLHLLMCRMGLNMEPVLRILERFHYGAQKILRVINVG